MSHDTFAHNLLLLMQDEIRCSFHFRLTAPANDNSETYEKYTWPHLRTINQLGKLFQEKSIHATWTIITFKISFYRIISKIPELIYSLSCGHVTLRFLNENTRKIKFGEEKVFQKESLPVLCLLGCVATALRSFWWTLVRIFFKKKLIKKLTRNILEKFEWIENRMAEIHMKISVLTYFCWVARFCRWAEPSLQAESWAQWLVTVQV